MSDTVYSHGKIITPGTPVVPGSRVLIAASVAGMVRLVLADGSFADIYAIVGTTEVPDLAVKDVNAAGTTATASITVLG